MKSQNFYLQSHILLSRARGDSMEHKFPQYWLQMLAISLIYLSSSQDERESSELPH